MVITMNRWFVVSQHFEWSGEHSGSGKVPSSLVHAKEMGTQTTAVGGAATPG